MKKLKVPNYDSNTVANLQNYAITSKAKDPWNQGKPLTKTFKSEVTRLLKIEQDKKCAYCCGRLHEKNPARDHIAPWSLYGKWMYLPENLVLACFSCNTDMKKTYDPILNEDEDYSKCEFSIIHPYLDDPQKHITFQNDKTSVLIQTVNGSSKGSSTITLFNLASPERSKQRAGDLLTSEVLDQLDPKYSKMIEAVLAHALEHQLKMKTSI